MAPRKGGRSEASREEGGTSKGQGGYEPETRTLEGLCLADRFYQPIQPDENGRLWSEQLGVFVGLWHGVVETREYDWVRLLPPNLGLPEQREVRRSWYHVIRCDTELENAKKCHDLDSDA